MDWISIETRPPDADDADEYGCVLVWDVNNGARTAGYKCVKPGGMLSHWQRLPPGPAVMEHSVDADMPQPVVELRLRDICGKCRNSCAPGEGTAKCDDCIIYSAHRVICSHYEDGRPGEGTGQ